LGLSLVLQQQCLILKKLLILKIGLVDPEVKQKNMSYKSIEIGASIRIGDVDQPNILVVPLALT
jgi:hypothetical protein